MVKKFLSKNYINRIYRPENRSLVDGLRCDKNERVELWSEDFVKTLLSEIKPIDLAIYPDLTSLYDLLSNFESISPEKILVSSGLDGCIKAIFECYTKPGMKIGIPGPTYGMYYVYSDAFETNVRHIDIDLDNFKLDKNDLEKAINEVDILFLPNPNAPIEDNLNLTEIHSLVKKCKEHNVLLVIDEVYYGFGSETAKELLDDFENLLIMRSFSKAFGMPSIRLGYMMGSIEMIKRLIQKRFSYETSSIQYLIAKKLIENKQLLYEYNLNVIKSRDQINLILQKAGYKTNADKGNFILVDFESESKKNKINDELLKENIYIKSSLSTRTDIVKNHEKLNRLALISIGPFEIMEPLVQILIHKNN